VMRPRSSSRGCNTSASVTVTVKSGYGPKNPQDQSEKVGKTIWIYGKGKYRVAERQSDV